MAGQPRPASRFRRLRGVDRMYLAIETPRTPMHMGALAIVDGDGLTGSDGALAFDAIRRRIAKHVGADPRLRRVIHDPGWLAGGPIWIDAPTFRIEQHVGRVAMPPSADPDALARSIERLMAPTLPRDRPLWRVWFMTGLPQGQVAVLFQIHHALADGATAMRLARAVLSPSVTGSAALSTEPAAGDPIPRWRDLVVDHLASRSAAVRRIRPSAGRAIVAGLRTFWAGYAAVRGEERTSLNRRIGPRRRLVWRSLGSDEVRQVARSAGVGVNDIILTLIAGGIRALLSKRGEAVERLAPRVGIAVALPVAAREDDSDNQFGGQVVALPLREGDPRRRLGQVATAREQAKRTQVVTAITAIRVWTARFPPTRALMRRQRFINVMETYLPGPPSPIAILGAPVRELVMIQPLGADVGLTFLASSYAGRITLAIRTDPDAFPDLDVLTRAMDREWLELAAPRGDPDVQRRCEVDTDLRGAARRVVRPTVKPHVRGVSHAVTRPAPASAGRRPARDRRDRSPSPEGRPVEDRAPQDRRPER